MTLVHGFRWEQEQIAGLEIKNATLMSQQLILHEHAKVLEDRVKLLEDQIRADEKEIARLKAELEIAWSDENDPLMQENRELQAQNGKLQSLLEEERADCDEFGQYTRANQLQASLDESKKLLRLWCKDAAEFGVYYSGLYHMTTEFLDKE